MPLTRQRFLVICRVKGTLEGIGTDTMAEAIRIIADDDYGLGQSAYEAIYDSGAKRVVCGAVLEYEVTMLMAERKAA